MSVEFPKDCMLLVDVSQSTLKSEATLLPNLQRLGLSASDAVRFTDSDTLGMPSAPASYGSDIAVRTAFYPLNLPAGAADVVQAAYAGLLSAAVKAMGLDEKAIRAIR